MGYDVDVALTVLKHANNDWRIVLDIFQIVGIIEPTKTKNL
jgi:hypothetical protein